MPVAVHRLNCYLCTSLLIWIVIAWVICSILQNSVKLEGVARFVYWRRQLLRLFSVGDEWMNRALVECRWQSKTVVLGEEPLRLPLGPAQVARRVARDWTRISPVRGRRLTGPWHRLRDAILNPDDRSASFHNACRLRVGTHTCNVTALRNTVSWQCGRDLCPRNVSKVGYGVTIFWYVTRSRVSSTLSRYGVTIRGNVTSVYPP
jgi:hypothetical protein